MRILERNEFVYKYMCAQVQRSRKLRRPKDDLNVFAYTRKILTVIWVKTSLEFTSGLEFEFVIVISIRDSNMRTHVLKIRH